MNFIEYLTEYSDCRALAIAPRTYETEKRIIKLYIAPIIDNTLQVEHVQIQDIIAILQPPYTAGHTRTAEQIYIYLKAASKTNEHYHSIMEKIQKPRHYTKQSSFLEPDELQKLIAAANGYMKIVLILCGIYGLRRGEVCGLQWRDISAASITIKRQKQTINGVTVTTPLKTQSAYRTLPLTEELRKALMPAIQARENIECTQNDFLIQVKPNALNQALYKLCEKTGVKKIGVHALRHTAASIAINYGNTNLKVVQTILGHSSVTTTAQIYSHVNQKAIENTLKNSINNLTLNQGVQGSSP